MESLYAKYKECGGVVTTDSRAIKGGEMFFALKGENFDGNEYALKALEAGARYAVVNDSSAAAKSGAEGIIAVPDSYIALKDLANYHRNHILVDGRRLPVIGLTGTNGKTTTKELIKAVLSTAFNVTATEGNLNNDIGVPLSLLKIKEGCQIAVIEMGASHPLDIKHLVDICEPDFGLITNVGKAHLLGFGSFEGVKATKGELYDFIKEHGGMIFLNVDDMDLLRMAMKRDLPFVAYGLKENGAKVLPITPEAPFVRVEMEDALVESQLVGAYNANNILAAMAVGMYFGIMKRRCVEAINSYAPSNNRSQMVKTGRNTLIVDAYNANPSSMKVALDNFVLVQAQSKLALLGDMRELGEESQNEHRAIVRRIVEQNIDAILVGGEFKTAVATENAAIRCFDSSQDLALYLKENPVDGTVVLVKGSRGIKMENVIQEL